MRRCPTSTRRRPPKPPRYRCPPNARRTSPPASTAGSMRTSGRSVRSARSRPTARRLGNGLVDVPLVKSVDPQRAVLADPVVAEGKRFCWKCSKPVGRTDASGPVRRTGCARTAAPPTISGRCSSPGEMVAGQYEVQGCIAHGGLGWIYLAIDRNVSDRWVVLKGLLHFGDAEAQAVAVAERQFLAEVAHPSIVKIHNFVEQPDCRTAPRSATSSWSTWAGARCKEVLDTHEKPERMPVEQAIAYLLEILPALDVSALDRPGVQRPQARQRHGHRGPAQVDRPRRRRAHRSLRIPVRHPRVTRRPRSPRPARPMASDIYTVGRTLAVLTLDMPMRPAAATSTACRPPSRRHCSRSTSSSTDCCCVPPTPIPTGASPPPTRWLVQLTGVLREVARVATGEEQPWLSTVFSPQRTTFGATEAVAQIDAYTDGDRRGRTSCGPRVVARALPVPLVDPFNACAPLIAAAVHSDPLLTLDSLRHAREEVRIGNVTDPESFEFEVTLAEVKAFLDAGERERAAAALTVDLDELRPDWRVEWYRGLRALVDERVPGRVRPFRRGVRRRARRDSPRSWRSQPPRN